MSQSRKPVLMSSALVLIVVCLFNSPAQAKYSGGTGKPNDPYQIATAADLIALGSEPNDYSRCFILTADINLDPNLPGNRIFDGAVIAPDTNRTTTSFQGPVFTGKLDGQDHVIVGMAIDSDVPYAGLFGMIGNGGRVRNLHLMGGSVQSRGPTITSRPGVVVYGDTGSLAGAITGALIIRCSNTCSVSCTGGASLGGLVGSAGNSTIAACYNTGSVRGTVGVAGGLVGGSGYSTILSCYNAGSVNATSDRLGGLLGMNSYGAVLACYNTGTVHSTATAHDPAAGFSAGLVGDNSTGTIFACYNAGPTSAQLVSPGGLVKLNDGTILSCFWDTKTSGQTQSAGGKGLTTSQMVTMQTFVNAGWDFLGESANGLCEYWQMPAGGGYPVLSVFQGRMPHILQGTGTSNDPYLLRTAEDLGTAWYNPTACYQLTADIDLSGIVWGMGVIPAFYGSLDGQTHRIAGMTIAGGGLLGLISFLSEGAMVHDLNLENLTSTGAANYVGALVGWSYGGTISASSSAGTVHGGNFVGGLVGANSPGTISACLSMSSVSGSASVGGLAGAHSGGTVSTSYATGSVQGKNNVGGFVGYTTGTTSCCYSTGAVIGTGSGVGGFAGDKSTTSTISACFWDIQTSGQVASDGGTGRTTVQMQTARTFTDAGWDFVGETANGTADVWWIEEGKDYPRLWSEAK
jgi:hypothetical protein